MSHLPKRPSVPVAPSSRPSSLRDATADALAFGGGAVTRQSAIASRSTAKKTIMIVDPDAGHRARLRALLEPQYDVIEAKDGMEAVELTSTVPALSMIVSDTAMPRVDGFTLAKILRNNPVLKRTPIMFVSVQHSPQNVTQALVIGVSNYMPKTTPVAQIAEKIRKIVL